MKIGKFVIDRSMTVRFLSGVTCTSMVIFAYNYTKDASVAVYVFLATIAGLIYGASKP